jgi:transketolase
MFEEYKKQYPELAKELEISIQGKLPEGWDKDLPVFSPEDKAVATRSASGKVLNAIAPHIPNLIGGSADLAPSNKTYLNGYGDFYCDENPTGRNIHFGIREHAMGAAVNGMTLHGGVIPYGATFLVFSDYMREPLRMAALMDIHSIFIFTHDSIGVGEDGPTHQPIEHVMSLRIIPNLVVIRPADANETVEAWKLALEEKNPVALIFTRQNVPILDPKKYPIKEGVKKGAYVLSDCDGTPDLIIIATGSEVHLALKGKEQLEKEGIKVRVVSMPSWEIFEEQTEEYKKSVLIPDIPKLAIEAGVTTGWQKYVRENGDVIGIDRFGESAPGNIVMEKFGFNVENVVNRAKLLLK